MASASFEASTARRPHATARIADMLDRSLIHIKPGSFDVRKCISGVFGRLAAASFGVVAGMAPSLLIAHRPPDSLVRLLQADPGIFFLLILLGVFEIRQALIGAP